MKTFILFAILLLSLTTAASAQHEYAPLQEKEIKYKDWTYKQANGGQELNLRDFTKGKKLVLVVYFAPWCPNWKLQAPFTQKLYEKYKASGLAVVGVGEYDTVEAVKASADNFKITFPVVYESDSRDAKQKTLHYEYRRATGDTRNWGSPWSIFLVPSSFNKKGDVLTEKTMIVNGELIEAETEAFVREKLGLPKEEKKAEISKNKEIEVCEPAVMSFKKAEPER
jgi:peroxiredoxin